MLFLFYARIIQIGLNLLDIIIGLLSTMDEGLLASLDLECLFKRFGILCSLIVGSLRVVRHSELQISCLIRIRDREIGVLGSLSQGKISWPFFIFSMELEDFS